MEYNGRAFLKKMEVGASIQDLRSFSFMRPGQSVGVIHFVDLQLGAGYFGKLRPICSFKLSTVRTARCRSFN